jgi:DNA-binding SARP family transcriptional activator/EAL domain-containing protein (putative c-di-GMP-specific phosphodiesterase class I)
MIKTDGHVTTPSALPGMRAELVFAYLAVEHRRSVTREELANALWPELLPDSWAAALRGVVTEVRRFLDDAGLAGHELIVGARGGYQLQLPSGITVDVDEAREAIAAARVRLDRGDGAGAAGVAAKAAALTASRFLPRHDGEWVEQVREELEAVRSAALELETRGHAEAGDTRAARGAAERLVRLEPYRESAHQLLIEVLGRAGDRAGALAAYQRCRAVLRSELGLDPSPDTDAVLQRALGARHPGAVAEHNAFASYVVLVVEDHDFQRRTALALLRRLGVGTLLEASDGGAALDLLATSPQPDIVICDIDMPGMDGVEFIRHVARRGLANAVAIASGLERSMLDAVRAVGVGYGLQVLGAVEKPLTGRVLGELLAAYQPATAADHDALRRLSSAEIAAGIEDGRIVAELEPIVDLSSGRIVAAEVVPRWRERAGAGAEAASFAAALETEASTERFSDRLIELAGQAARDLAAAGVALEIAVGLAPARLADATLADHLAGLVRAHGAEPRQLVPTIRAAALPGGAATALDVLARLRLKGFGLWLDDAGSTARLKHMPLTGVRLAAPLISGAATDPARVASLRDAVDHARSRRLVAIGTGCASPAEFDVLLEVGASHAQGTFLARPMTTEQLVAVAPRWTPPTAVSDVP